MRFINFSFLAVQAILVCNSMKVVSGKILLPKVRCYLGILSLRFDTVRYERYETYFRNDSMVRVVQIGVFKGSEDIKEYMRFPASKLFQDGSNFFQNYSAIIPREKSFVKFDTNTGLCEFLGLQETRTVSNATYATGQIAGSAVTMGKVYYSLKEKYVKKMDLYFPAQGLGVLFGNIFAGTKTQDFICNVMEGPCNALVTQHTDCRLLLAALPYSEGELNYIDSNTTGCRVLHAVFAEKNPTHHCPHIAIEPTPDYKGRIKCQVSEYKQISDYFSLDDVTKYKKFATKLGYDPDVGYKILNLE